MARIKKGTETLILETPESSAFYQVNIVPVFKEGQDHMKLSGEEVLAKILKLLNEAAKK